MHPVADLLTERTRNSRSSVIREILALTEAGGVLSLAGGMPSPDSFPVGELAEAAARTISGQPAQTLQYARTDGATPLRELLAAETSVRRGRDTSPDQIVVTTGSQQALDLIARAFLDPGDLVAIESPGYLGAIQAFGTQQPTWLPIEVDADGLDTDRLEAELTGGARPKIVYTATDFQNPSGAVLSPARRRHLAVLADRYGFIVVEDDPYGWIRFGEPVHDPVGAHTDRVISLGTTSKTLAPGLRIGWLVAPVEIATALSRLKQAVDLNSSALAQYLTLELLGRPEWAKARAVELSAFYRPRAERLRTALVDAAPDLDVPAARGGLFLWATAPGVDTTALLPRAVDNGVAFVPESAFRTDDVAGNSFRVSFATLADEELDEAAARLGATLASPPLPV